MAKVAADIFAHYYIYGRNLLAVKLIVSVCGCVCVRVRVRVCVLGNNNISSLPLPLPPSFPPSLSPSLPPSPQDALKSEESYNMNEDLKLTLSQLASLSYHKNSKVALAARQVGVAYSYHSYSANPLFSFRCSYLLTSLHMSCATTRYVTNLSLPHVCKSDGITIKYDDVIITSYRYGGGVLY